MEDGMIICAVDETRESSAAAAFASWLSRRTGARLLLQTARTGDDFLTVAERDETSTLVVPRRGSVTAGLKPTLSLVNRARRPVIVMTEAALAAWATPSRAEREVRPVTVCGTDGSRLAAAAATCAALLAAALGGKLVLVHAERRPVVRPPAAGNPLHGLERQLQSGRRAGLLRRSVAELEECPPEVVALHRYGEPVDVLDGVAASESAALLAVGTAGVGADRVALTGSVAAELLQRSRHPVLVTPPAPYPGLAGRQAALAERVH
jgi:nucleotide-binding universal stress UspA family protein